MAKNLLIVESPAKAKTIEKYLGADFTVRSCYGHIRDLQKEKMGIDVDNNFEPQYIISEDKEKVVAELTRLMKKNDEVWLATDEDREGEAISWHLCEALGLDVQKTKRIVFHEITKNAILKAIQEPRKVDMNLVDAQQARRVLDRLVGFKLSPLLQRKLSFQVALSAGRVQSVAVKLIVEREREINQFTSLASYKIRATFNAPNAQKKLISFYAEREDITTESDAIDFLDSCKKAQYTVDNVDIKKGKRNPAAPFTTSTLQQEAAKKLGYSVSRTMSLAQKLYENGDITYMRTDSVNLSGEAIKNIQIQIEKQFGKDYAQVRQFKNKNSNAQEAHEAIRPTNMTQMTIDNAEGKRLYELIWKRTMASQMAEAKTEKTQVTIGISTRKDKLKAEGEVILFDGFLALYLESKDEDKADEEDEKILPPLQISQQLGFEQLEAKQKYSRPSARYGEAALVKKLEELGIGRPSTYAATINTIIKRNYVEKKDRDPQIRPCKILTLTKDIVHTATEMENFGAEKNKLFPTDLGIIVTDFLSEHFSDIMNYQFTADVENDLDKIAEGNLKWKKVISEFYAPFLNSVENNLKDKTRMNSERILGQDPATKKTILTRMARYGPVVQLGTSEESEKPLFANLRPHQSIETITLKDALELFTLPKNMGQFEGEDVVISIGRFGPYIQHNKKYVSIPKGADPYTITLQEAIATIEDKRRLPRNVGVYEGKELLVNVGRFGPYVAHDDNFYSLKKGTDVYTISLDEVMPMLMEQKAKKEKNTLRSFPDQGIQIMTGRFGPYIKKGRENIKITKDIKDKIETIEIKELEEFIAQQTKKSAPKTKQKIKAVADKTFAPKKKSVTKKVVKKVSKKVTKK